MRLYWRIFLSFWLAMTLIVAGSVLVSLQLASERYDEFQRARPMELVAEATRVLQERNVEGLTEWLQDAREPIPGLQLFLLDESGRDLLERELPRRFRMHAERFERMHPEAPPPHFRRGRPLPRLVGRQPRDLSGRA